MPHARPLSETTPADLTGRKAYSPDEAAAVMGASHAWIYNRIKDGTIPSVKIAGRRFIPAPVIDALLDEAS